MGLFVFLYLMYFGPISTFNADQEGSERHRAHPSEHCIASAAVLGVIFFASTICVDFGFVIHCAVISQKAKPPRALPAVVFGGYFRHIQVSMAHRLRQRCCGAIGGVLFGVD